MRVTKCLVWNSWRDQYFSFQVLAQNWKGKLKYASKMTQVDRIGYRLPPSGGDSLMGKKIQWFSERQKDEEISECSSEIFRGFESQLHLFLLFFFPLIVFFLFLYFLEFLFLFFLIFWDICSSVFKYHFRFRLNLLLAPYFQFGSCCFSFEEIWSTGVMLLFKKFKKLMKKNIWLQVCWIKWDPSVKWDPKVEGGNGIWREVTWSDVIW